MLIQPALSRGKKLRKPKVITPAAPQLDLSPQGLINDWQKKYGEAKTANETRYGDILAGYNERYATGMGNLIGAGAQAAADINEASQKQAAGVQQNLVSAGLAGTTVMPTMQMGVERERLSEQGRLNEQLRKERLSTQAGLSQDTLNFKERREDSYPEMSQYTNLLTALGAGGMGGNVGTGGGVGGTGIGGTPVAPKTNNAATDSMDEIARQYNNYKARWQQRPGQMAYGAPKAMDYNTWLNMAKSKGYAGVGA